MADKPTVSVEWASNANALKIQSDADQLLYGWNTSDGTVSGRYPWPNLQNQNWLQDASSDWINYLSDCIDEEAVINKRDKNSRCLKAVRNTSTYTVSTSDVNLVYYSSFLKTFIAMNDFQRSNISYDGTNWSGDILHGASGDLYAGSENGSLVVIVGSGGKILTSPDLFNWTSRTSGVAFNIRDIAYNGTEFIAVGDSSQMIRSSDGITWTNGANLANTTDINAIIYSTIHQRWIAASVATAGTNNMWYSDDGTNWSVSDGFYNTFRDMAEDESGRIVAATNFANAANIATIIYSDDGGSSWAVGTHDISLGGPTDPGSLGRPHYANEFGMWIAIANSDHLSISYNGIDWVRYILNFRNIGSGKYAYSPDHRAYVVGHSTSGTILRTL